MVERSRQSLVAGVNAGENWDKLGDTLYVPVGYEELYDNFLVDMGLPLYWEWGEIDDDNDHFLHVWGLPSTVDILEFHMNILDFVCEQEMNEETRRMLGPYVPAWKVWNAQQSLVLGSKRLRR